MSDLSGLQDADLTHELKILHLDYCICVIVNIIKDDSDGVFFSLDHIPKIIPEYAKCQVKIYNKSKICIFNKNNKTYTD